MKYVRAFFRVALRELREHFWMWAAMAACAFHDYPIAIGFAIWAFYDKLTDIRDLLAKDIEGAVTTTTIINECRPGGLLASYGDAKEEHF